MPPDPNRVGGTAREPHEASGTRAVGSLRHVGYDIRTFGDPVLAAVADEVENIDAKIVRLSESMLQAMYRAPGLGLAAPQIGVQKKIFVYDIDDQPITLINPRIVESSGEWVYDEGCLSIPGLYVEMLRPKQVLLEAVDLDGNEIRVEADELLARLFQHELDHLNGVLMFDRMTEEQKKEALAEYRKIVDGQVPRGESRHIVLK
ncbi:MAG: peptide deformylase [Actinomycetota bacterium]